MSAPATAAQLPRPGDIIGGKYVLDHLIGQGGMGAVFAARHIKLSKAVAIKIMLADAGNPEAAQRFINEGRAAANIQNEHVVRVDDVDEEHGYAYMVLELLEGEDLAQVLEREPARRLAPPVAVNYVSQALRGVMQAHAIGIVHRDLKPSNLFLARRKDGSVVVKVLDFGISKAQGSSALAASPSALTSTKAMLGSPLYMSPEQLRSSKSVDHRADIWAMGVILYELMSGALPFMGDNLGELFAAILETDPTPLRQRVPGMPPALDDVVLRCLQRRPEARFQSAAELAQALLPFGGAVLGGTAILGPASSGAAPPAFSTTPGPATRPQPPAPGSVTSGSGPRAVGGTMAIPGSTPQGLQLQTGSGWQSNPSKPSKAPVIAAVAVVATLAASVAGGYAWMNRQKPGPRPDPSALATSAPPPPASTVVPPPPPPATTTAAPEASSAPPVKTSTPPATASTVKPHVAVKPADPKPADPKPEPPKPPPKPTSTGTPNLQDFR